MTETLSTDFHCPVCGTGSEQRCGEPRGGRPPGPPDLDTRGLVR